MRDLCYTSLRRTLILIILAVLAAAFAFSAFFLMLHISPSLLDKNRLYGMPTDIPEEQGYRSYSAEGVCDVALCGNPLIDGRSVRLLLTNPASNTVWLRAEIYSVSFAYDAAGNITAASPDKKLGESGFIRPGEYVEEVSLSRRLKEDKVYVMIKIATYVEESGTSNGYFYINTALFP